MATFSESVPRDIGIRTRLSLARIAGWNALFGPPGLPEPVVEAWTTALAELPPRAREVATLAWRPVWPFATLYPGVRDAVIKAIADLALGIGR